ncbi:MAG: hypothetical protein ACW99U_03130 [Candidatus Thorarchaeota archaeon]
MSSEEGEDLLGHEGEDATGKLHHLEDELKLTGRYSMARVHVAENVFDGVLPLLGVILAGIIAAGPHPQDLLIVFQTTLLASFGTSIAHFISGFGGAYLVETAEGRHLVKELEKTNQSRFTHSVIVKAERDTTLLLSAIKGGVPSGAVLITISPMFLALFGVIGYVDSFFVSIAVGLTLLFVLGLFLGRVSRTSMWISAMKTLMAGILTLIVLIVVSLLTGA